MVILAIHLGIFQLVTLEPVGDVKQANSVLRHLKMIDELKDDYHAQSNYRGVLEVQLAKYCEKCY